jgi:hypothetical protein
VLPIGFALALLAISAMPAAAAHNPDHQCPAWIAEQIAKGVAGGSYYVAGDRVTWTDGVLVCVLQGGIPKTLFKSRNAETYIAKDAAAHAATKVSASTASKIISAAGKVAGPSGINVIAIPKITLCSVMNYLQGCQATEQR